MFCCSFLLTCKLKNNIERFIKPQHGIKHNPLFAFETFYQAGLSVFEKFLNLAVGQVFAAY